MARHRAEPTIETQRAEELAQLIGRKEIGPFTYARHRYFPKVAIECRLCRESDRIR